MHMDRVNPFQTIRPNFLLKMNKQKKKKDSKKTRKHKNVTSRNHMRFTPFTNYTKSPHKHTTIVQSGRL